MKNLEWVANFFYLGLILGHELKKDKVLTKEIKPLEH